MNARPESQATAEDRDPWRLWLVLLAELEAGRCPSQEVREWFVHGARGWSEAVGEDPLHAFLGIERRRRLDYLRARLAELFQEAAEAVAPTESAWRAAAIVERELGRYERRTWPHHRGKPINPAWSRRDQAFARLLALPIAAPRTQRRIHGLLPGAPVVSSVDEVLGSQPMASEAPPMKQTDSIEERARREFETSAAIRHEFMDDLANYISYRKAEAAGWIKRIRGAGNE